VRCTAPPRSAHLKRARQRDQCRAGPGVDLLHAIVTTALLDRLTHHREIAAATSSLLELAIPNEACTRIEEL
jgi:hypothetical protein